MAEQITSENTKKILLEGNGAPQPQRRPTRSNLKADVIVENANEKRYLWTARAFAIIFAVSLFCNLIFVYLIITIIPLYRVDPYLFSFVDKSEQVYDIEPIRGLEKQDLITELLVREYILLRNTFVNDLDEMDKRWGENGTIRYMSTDKVYSTFIKTLASRAKDHIRKYNLTRNIKIVSVIKVGEGVSADRRSRGTWWKVEFRLEDMTPELEVPKVSVWEANLLVGYVGKQVKFGERLKNPLGFTVGDYRQTKRSKSD